MFRVAVIVFRFSSKFYLDFAFFQGCESLLVFLEELPFPGLQVEPCERKGLHVWQSGLYERMEFVLEHQHIIASKH